MEEIRLRYPKMDLQNSLRTLTFQLYPSRKQVEKYNDQLDAFYSAWERSRDVMQRFSGSAVAEINAQARPARRLISIMD
jgi:hypothetical protein